MVSIPSGGGMMLRRAGAVSPEKGPWEGLGAHDHVSVPVGVLMGSLGSGQLCLKAAGQPESVTCFVWARVASSVTGFSSVGA